MNNSPTVSHGGVSCAALLRTLFPLVVTAALAGGLWIVTMPAARARLMTPTEMIQESLPTGKSMQTAAKPEVLSAVCGAVRRHRPSAPEITRAVVTAHPEYAGEVVKQVLHCSANVDCDFVARIVGDAVRTYPAGASEIDDAAAAVAPDCTDAIEAATAHRENDGKEVIDGKEAFDGKETLPPAEGPGNFAEGAPTNQLPVPGLPIGGGGGFNPSVPRYLVCDNGTQRRVNQTDLVKFFNSHPGAFFGTCQPTPTTNR